MNPKVALLQLVSSCDPEKNIPRVESMILEAAASSVDAIFLPENFGALAAVDPRAIGEHEATPAGPLRTLLSSLAAEKGVWIFAGTMPCSVRPDGSPVPQPRIRAASFVYDALGHEVARYDKIHMFDVEVEDGHKHYLESATFEAGEELRCVDTPVGKVGLSVCYDIRFSEVYRELFMAGATALAIPSAFTRPTGEAHFEILMRARAIESFAFTIAACQGGVHDSGRETYGNSMLVSPWGDVLCRAGGDGEEILITELDLEQQARTRKDMPVHLQRRL